MKQGNMSKTASTHKYIEMPSSMFFEEKERQLRESITGVEKSIITHIKNIRNLGVDVNDDKDLKQMTPDYIRKEIQKSKKARLENIHFLPVSIRQREEDEFSKMESQLTTIAKALQESLSRYPFRVCINGDEIYFDGNDVEDYVEKESSVEIPEVIREYYTKLQEICRIWRDMSKWCEENNLIPPNMGLIRSISHDESLDSPELTKYNKCTLSVTPEEMFRMYLYGSSVRIIKDSDPV